MSASGGGVAAPETYGYCERWNKSDGVPIDPIGEDEARRRYDGGVLFTALRTEAGRIVAALEVQPGVRTCIARFFDESLSNHLVYTFARHGERLFLSQAAHYDYPDGGFHTFPQSRVTTIYVFRPSGVVRRNVNDKSRPTVSIEDRDGVDVSGNWEPVPGFGNWSSLLRIDR